MPASQPAIAPITSHIMRPSIAMIVPPTMRRHATGDCQRGILERVWECNPGKRARHDRKYDDCCQDATVGNYAVALRLVEAAASAKANDSTSPPHSGRQSRSASRSRRSSLSEIAMPLMLLSTVAE